MNIEEDSQKPMLLALFMYRQKENITITVKEIFLDSSINLFIILVPLKPSK
jgi:hypothetical protein